MCCIGGAWYADGGGGPRLPTRRRRADHAAGTMPAVPPGRMPGGAMDASTAGPPASGAAGRGDRRPGRRPTLRSPWKGAGGVEAPPTGGMGGGQNTCRSAATAACLRFRRSPTPPPNLMGGLGEHGGHDGRRTRAVDGPGPRGSGFSRGHDDAWTGSAVPGRSAATRPGGGVTPAGAGTG